MKANKILINEIDRYTTYTTGTDNYRSTKQSVGNSNI